MAIEDYYLPPRITTNSQEVAKATEAAIKNISQMTTSEKEQHYQKLELKIAKISKHSYEVNQGQARTLSKYEHVKYKG
jgi:hypothetical protein